MILWSPNFLPKKEGAIFSLVKLTCGAQTYQSSVHMPLLLGSSLPTAHIYCSLFYTVSSLCRGRRETWVLWLLCLWLGEWIKSWKRKQDPVWSQVHGWFPKLFGRIKVMFWVSWIPVCIFNWFRICKWVRDVWNRTNSKDVAKSSQRTANNQNGLVESKKRQWLHHQTWLASTLASSPHVLQVDPFFTLPTAGMGSAGPPRFTLTLGWKDFRESEPNP